MFLVISAILNQIDNDYTFVSLIIYCCLPFFYALGLLANIYITFIWMIELINLYIFGDSTKATDLRTIA